MEKLDISQRLNKVRQKLSNFIEADFPDSIFTDTKRERLSRAVDKIRNKFGDFSINRAGTKL